MAAREFSQFPFHTLTRVCSNGNTRWTPGRKSGQPTVIFIHTTEGSEGRQSAENGTAYDGTRTDGTSCHFMVDQDSTWQEVFTYDEAHAARSHGNDVGIQIEVCGRTDQTVGQWNDAASVGAVEQCAYVCVALRAKYGKTRFPLVNLTPAQLRAGHNGFAEHLDATLAWPEDGGTHTDPGPNFPWAKLFARITELETPKEWDELATQAQLKEAFLDALQEAIPVSGRQGERIRAAGWGEMSIEGRLGYLMEMIANAERKPGVSGSIMARLNRLEDESEAQEAQLNAMTEALARIEESLAELPRTGA